MGGVMAIIIFSFAAAGDVSAIERNAEEQALAGSPADEIFLVNTEGTTSERAADLAMATILVVGVASVAAGTGTLVAERWALNQS